MLAKDLTPEHNGKTFRTVVSGITFRCDDSVVGEETVLIREQPAYTWTMDAETELEIIG